MRAILLSIKPQFVNEIRSNRKLFEYRKKIFKDVNIDKILIYSSFPEKKIVGICDIEEVLYNDPERIWKLTKDYSGISKFFFDEYFSNHNHAYAIKLKNIYFFKIPFSLKDIGVKKAPQSFMYIELNNDSIYINDCLNQ